MPWRMVTCTYPGCGRMFPSLTPYDHECDDKNHHYNLDQKAEGGGTSHANVPVGKKGRTQSLPGAGGPGAGKGKKKGCDMVLLPAGAIAIGVAMALTKLIRGAR